MTTKKEIKTGPNPFAELKKELLDAIEKNKEKETILGALGADHISRDDVREDIEGIMMSSDSNTDIVEKVLARTHDIHAFVGYLIIAVSTQTKAEMILKTKMKQTASFLDFLNS